MSSPNYITTNGFENLKFELNSLYTERPKVVETVTWAASLGDRSENADYQYGKKRLREIDRRIRFLLKRLELSEVINPKKITNKKIVFAATITISNENEEQKSYQIVGEDEIDTSGGKISWKSPIAKALLGKIIGDEVLVRKPKGDEWIEILNIEYK